MVGKGARQRRRALRTRSRAIAPRGTSNALARVLTPGLLRQLASMRQAQVQRYGGYSQPIVRRQRQRNPVMNADAVNAVWLQKSAGMNADMGGIGKFGSKIEGGVVKLKLPLSQIAASITTDGSGTALYNVVISPGTLSSRNGQFSAIFEQAHIEAVRIRWVPTASAGDPGTIISCVDYNNSVGSFPNTLVLASQREKEKSHAVWVPWEHEVIWRPSDKIAFVNSASSASHRSDGFVYAIGFVCEGAKASTLIGHICIDEVVTYSGLKAV